MELEKIVVIEEVVDRNKDLVVCMSYAIKTDKGDYIVTFLHVSNFSEFRKHGYAPEVFSMDRFKSRACGIIDNCGKHEAFLCVTEVEVDNPDESKWSDYSSPE